MSHVMCHVSYVICNMSRVTSHIFSLQTNFWRVCYQRGLPHIVNKMIQSLSHPFPPNLQNTITPKPYQLGTFTSIHVLHVTCRMSCVMCHMSYATCHVSQVSPPTHSTTRTPRKETHFDKFLLLFGRK